MATYVNGRIYNIAGGVSSDKIVEATENWLDENVDPATGYVVDKTLTIENAAADAKTVGDLKSAFDFYSCNKSVIQRAKGDTGYAWGSTAIPCNFIAGQVVTATNNGNSNIIVAGYSADNTRIFTTRNIEPGATKNLTVTQTPDYMIIYCDQYPINVELSVSSIDEIIRTLLNNGSIINIRGVGTQSSGNSGVTGINQYYVHSSQKTLKHVIAFTSPTSFTDETLSFGTNNLYYYNGDFYYYSGSGDFDGLVLIEQPSTRVYYIRGVGTKSAGNSGVTGIGQFYVHAIERKLKLIVSYTSPTNFTDKTLDFETDPIYFYNGEWYKYSGSNYFDGLVAINNFEGQTVAKNRILSAADMDVCCYARGLKFTEDLNDTLIDFAKTGDLMVHVSTFCIIDGIVYCSYYANTRTAQEDPTKQTARFAYCTLSDPSDMVYIDVQDVGDTFDSKTVQRIYDTILMRKDDSTIYIMWTAMLDGAYYRLYRTFDVSTQQLGNVSYNTFHNGETGGNWNTQTMETALANVPHRKISGDIGIMQKITSRVEDGTTYYYTGAYAEEFNCIIKSSDLIDWKFVACPDVRLDTQFENAVYVYNDVAYYFVRMYSKYNCGILTSYNLTNGKWSDPVFVNDAQSRSDFILYGNALYLIHAPNDRYHLSAMRINTGLLNNSYEFQTAYVSDYFYPYVDIYNGELYMSFTKTRQHIYLSKFNIYNTNDYSNPVINAKFKDLLFST